MLSYQHAYHAGNHADILKHYVLSSVIQSLNKKEKPYTLYDTHAGSGLYDLLDNRSLKTNEAEKGILKFAHLQLPECLGFYKNLVQKYLDKAILSVINQTLKNIEIICVNDGSTDNSLSILQKYQKLEYKT